MHLNDRRGAGSSFERGRQKKRSTLARSPSHPHPLSFIPHSNRTGLLSSYLQHDVSTMFLLTARLSYVRPSSAKSLIALFPDDGLISISHLRMAPFRAKALGLGSHHSFPGLRLDCTLPPADLFVWWENIRSTCSTAMAHVDSLVRKSWKGFGRRAVKSAVTLTIRSEEMKSW